MKDLGAITTTTITRRDGDIAGDGNSKTPSIDTKVLRVAVPSRFRGGDIIPRYGKRILHCRVCSHSPKIFSRIFVGKDIVNEIPLLRKRVRLRLRLYEC